MTAPFALITGASSGIGFALAKQFIQNGYDLAICSGSVAIEDAAHTLRQQGRQVTAIEVDLSTFAGVEKLVAALQRMGRPLDAAAINAGVGCGGDFTHQTDLEEELAMIALNVNGTVHLAKRLLPDMCARRSGRVLFTASIAATMPGTYSAVYNATKAFVLSFAEAIRDELKDTGVSITALMPGATETNFFHRAHMDGTKVGAGEKDSADLVALQGFEALMAGKDSVVAGSLKTKLQGVANEILPETVKAAAHRQLAQPGSADVVKFLKAQHKEIKTLFARVIAASGVQRQALYAQLRQLMTRHEKAEEEIVHPVARRTIADGDAIVAKHLHEENEAKLALAALDRLPADSEAFATTLQTLYSAVLAHAESEETHEFDALEKKIDGERLKTMTQQVERVEGPRTQTRTPAAPRHA